MNMKAISSETKHKNKFSAILERLHAKFVKPQESQAKRIERENLERDRFGGGPALVERFRQF